MRLPLVIPAVLFACALAAGCGSTDETGQTNTGSSTAGSSTGGGTSDDASATTTGGTTGATTDATTGETSPDATTTTGTSATTTTGEDPEDAGSVSDEGNATTGGTEDVVVEEDVKPRPPVQESFSTTIGGWTMQPGQEVTKCVRKRLDNPMEAYVTAIHSKMAKGSHHLVIYRSGEETEKLEPFDCTPFVETLNGKTIPLMISQISDESLVLPDGVAFKFEPNQMVRLEVHYLNYYAEEITAQADVTFDAIHVDSVEAEADMLFYGTPDFEVPKNSTYQTPWFFLDVWAGTKVFAVTGHTHAAGTNVEVNFATGDADPGEPVYPLDKPFYWDEAPVITYDPPLEFASGEGFRYRCTWNNTTDKTLTFGESANKEMCFFWAYYYPSKGYRMCVNPGSLYPLPKACCPDLGALCDSISSFLEQ